MARAGLGAPVVIVLVWGAAVGLGKIRSFDYWWHLRTGEEIAATGHVPRHDPYSYTKPAARWIDMHWLFQVGLHRLHAAGGHEAVRLAKGLAATGLLAAVAALGGVRRREPVAGLVVALVAATGASRFLVRPDLVSFLLLAAVLGLLFRHERRGGWAVLGVVPLQLLWANVHGLFAVGLAVCGMALAAELLRPLLPGGPVRPRHAARLAAVLAFSSLASLANPNGLAGALFPLQQLGMIGGAETRGVLGHAIQELRPSLGLGPAALAPPALLALLAGTGLGLRRRVSAFDVLLLVAFAYLALTARRNLALFAVAVGPVAIRNLGAVWEERMAGRWQAAFGLPLLGAVAAAGAVLAAGTLSHAWRAEGGSHPAITPFQYPEAATAWIAREEPSGPLYHRMADGGYLIAKLYPEYRVMVDGRLEVYGAEAFAELDVLEGGTPEAFQRLDQRYRFGTALLHHSFLPDGRLLAWLAGHPDWRLVQLDEVAAVFVREGPGGELPWPALDTDAEGLFPPLDEGTRPALDLWRRRARIRILASLGRHARALQLAEATLERHRSGDVEALREWLREQLQGRDGGGAARN